LRGGWAELQDTPLQIPRISTLLSQHTSHPVPHSSTERPEPPSSQRVLNDP
jgi:hypothetical protein